MPEVVKQLVQRRNLQKLTAAGSSLHVTITRPILRHVGWLPGQLLVVEVLSDNSISVRAARDIELGPTVERAIPVPVAIEAGR